MKPRTFHWWSLAALLCLVVPLQLHAGDKKKNEPKDVVVKDELTNADLKDKVRTESYCKTFTYKMTEGRSYQIDMQGENNFDTYLRLENKAGEQVAEDDDGGGNLQARIVYKAVKTEDYTIVATTFAGGVTGKFTVTIKDLSPPVDPKKKAAGKSIELKNDKGQANFAGNLDANDEKYKNKTSKIFLFKMEEGKTYQIDHMSDAFDAYLYLEGPDGTLLAQDDDGGDGLNSRIVHKAAKAGTYRLIATSLSGNRTGAFTFSIRQMGCGDELQADADRK